MSEWTEYTKLLAGLIAIVNPLGAIPIYLQLTASLSITEKKKIAAVAAISTAIILILFTLGGTAILSFFGITIDAFRVAGGMLLLVMALNMMGAVAQEKHSTDPDDMKTIGIMPLAVPLMAGPGAISTVIVYSGQSASLVHTMLVVGVVLTVAAAIYVLLRGGALGSRFLGPVTVSVFNRIMGLIIAAIGVEFILDGIAAHYPGLLA
jgi:multiple antibiotic resistance protein